MSVERVKSNTRQELQLGHNQSIGQCQREQGGHEKEEEAADPRFVAPPCVARQDRTHDETLQRLAEILEQDEQEAQNRRNASASIGKEDRNGEDKNKDEEWESSENKRCKREHEVLASESEFWEYWWHCDHEDWRNEEQEQSNRHAAQAKAKKEALQRNGDTDSPSGQSHTGGYVTEEHRRLNTLSAEEGRVHRCITCWCWSPVFGKGWDSRQQREVAMKSQCFTCYEAICGG